MHHNLVQIQLTYLSHLDRFPSTCTIFFFYLHYYAFPFNCLSPFPPCPPHPTPHDPVSISFLIFSILLLPLLVYFSLLSRHTLQLVSPLVALSPSYLYISASFFPQLNSLCPPVTNLLCLLQSLPPHSQAPQVARLPFCSASHTLSSVPLPGPRCSAVHGSTFYPLAESL